MRLTTRGLFSALFTMLTAVILLVTGNLEAQTPPVLKKPVATLNWGANTEEDLVGYKIYRGLGKAVCNDGITPLAPLTVGGTAVFVPAGTTTYQDTTIDPVDGLVCYEITASDPELESGRSNRAVASLNANPPSAPRSLSLGVVIK